MAERLHSHLAATPPVTPPTKRGRSLQDLLAQFGSQKSAESATKSRRTSSALQLSDTSSQATESLKEEVPHDCSPKPVVIDTMYTVPLSPVNADKPKAGARQTRRSTARQHPTESMAAKQSSSEDELAAPIQDSRNGRASARISARTEELKMEKRRRERERVDGSRYSGRNRKNRILESDTLPQPPPLASRRKASPVRRLDSARNRLHDEIAQKTTAKANNFLVAHRDYFLPLLPPSNSIQKLIASHEGNPTVSYKELTEQPRGVTATMKPYQLAGLSYLVYLYNNGFSGILGDEMGLGKTLQTLSMFQYLEELDRENGIISEEPRPYLVVCPLSVLNSWVTEAQRWVPELTVLRFHGAATERARLKKVALGMEDMKGNETSKARDRKASKKAGAQASKASGNNRRSATFKIFVTTYDTFHAEQSWFKHSFIWRYVVLDEGHKIKSSVTQISTALHNIASEHRLILTGTPLQNNLVEMWALLAWLYPTVFVENTATLFKESFDLNRGKVNRQTMDDARRLLELIMLRRMKGSPGVDLGLPPKEEVLLYVPLTPMQRFWYTRLLTRVDNAMLQELFADGQTKEKAALRQDQEDAYVLQRVGTAQKTGAESHGAEWEETAGIMRQAMEKEQGSTQSKSAWQKLMNLVMQLRKCCSHPYLLPNVAPDPYYVGEHIIRASGKFILLEKLLRYTAVEQGKKVLIFSGFTHTLDYCEDLLALVSDGGSKFKHLRLDGSTQRAHRNLSIRLFNKEAEYKVMLLSTRAGGLGINLTSAQDVIFLDEDWNPQITLQAEARAHRIGQTKKVTIYKLCTQGTVEEQMMGRIRKKLYLSAKITESMRNIHSESTDTKASRRTALSEDMPQMDTSQLKTLIRRGAQTLSHPDIDATEMLSWDLETMMAKCRDKPTDLAASVQSEVDEEKWLSVMERVECAVFDGKRYNRQVDVRTKTSAKNILPDNVTRQDRRRGKNTTVMMDGFAISKESMSCGDWEAVPTMAGKDPRLAEPVREKRREITHEEHCLDCFEGLDAGDLIECRSCPRAYHYDCLEAKYQVKVKGLSGFYCPQHSCVECGKNTTDAGGLIYRCRWCPKGFCEDCLDWDTAELVADNLPEFVLLGETSTQGGFYIKCPSCIDDCTQSDEQREWLNSMEETYKVQHTSYLEDRAKEQQELEHDAAQMEGEAHGASVALPILPGSPSRERKVATLTVNGEAEDDAASPPALTDTSLPTPALVGSRVSTPSHVEPLLVQSQRSKGKGRVQKRGDREWDVDGSETRSEKKARLDAQVWAVDDDPLLASMV